MPNPMTLLLFDVDEPGISSGRGVRNHRPSLSARLQRWIGCL